jgi:hypothetical protein
MRTLEERLIELEAHRAGLRLREQAARARLEESQANLDRFFNWREWFGFRPGWPKRRALKLAELRRVRAASLPAHTEAPCTPSR